MMPWQMVFGEIICEVGIARVTYEIELTSVGTVFHPLIEYVK